MGCMFFIESYERSFFCLVLLKNVMNNVVYRDLLKLLPIVNSFILDVCPVNHFTLQNICSYIYSQAKTGQNIHSNIEINVDLLDYCDRTIMIFDAICFIRI